MGKGKNDTPLYERLRQDLESESGGRLRVVTQDTSDGEQVHTIFQTDPYGRGVDWTILYRESTQNLLAFMNGYRVARQIEAEENGI